MESQKEMGSWTVKETTNLYRIMHDTNEGIHKAVLLHDTFDAVDLKIEVYPDGKLQFQTNWLISVVVDPKTKEIEIRMSEEPMTSKEWID